jgi:CheY-like chemotaxis protein
MLPKKEILDSGRSLKILLGEDNELNRKLAVKILSDFNCFVEVASNGKEVLEKFDKGEYDVILMDIQMPELDGYAAIRKICCRKKRA